MEAHEPADLTGTAALAVFMRSAQIIDVLPLPGGGGHAKKRTVIFEGSAAAAAKYADPAPPHTETQIRAEVAAWVLAAELGWQDLVPTTVLRQLPDPDDPGQHVEASVQLFVPMLRTSLDGGFGPADCGETDVARGAVFDRLALNTDRNSTNWGRIDGTSCPKLIDHGHAFETFDGAATGDFIQAANGLSLPNEVVACVQDFVQAEAHSGLPDIIGDDKAARVFERARQVVDNATV